MSTSSNRPSRIDEALTGAALFRGAAVIADRTGQIVGLQIVLDRRAGRHGAAAQQMMAAAMAGLAQLDGVVAHAVRLLAQARQGVELTQDGHDGVAGAIAGQQRSLHTGNAPLHLEPLLLHHFRVQLRGLSLLKHQLRIVPDLVAGLGKDGQLFFYELLNSFLAIRHK